MRFLFAGLLLILPASFVLAEEPNFERQIAPLLVRHCATCHNPSQPAGGLDLTSIATARRGGDSGSSAVTPGDLEKSLLVERIRSGEMPPPGKGTPVSSADLANLDGWIAAGAAWPTERVLSASEFTTEQRAGRDWWSLKLPVRPAVPAVKKTDRLRMAVDAFIEAQLENHGLHLTEATDRATFIRRVTLDVHGLPPSPEEVRAFVNDQSVDAFEKLIDRLLASPHYGERWGRHWLDVVRFGESHGYEMNGPRAGAWAYRDWVIAAFNNDMPLPQFVLAQLAGDQTGMDPATGFLVGGAHDAVLSPNLELTLQQRMNDLDDMLSTTSTAFLGLTVGCAKCHDHKFDPISQRDYYALQADFSGVQHGSRALRGPDHEKQQQSRQRLEVDLAALQKEIETLRAQHQPLARVGGSLSDAVRPAVNAQRNIDRFAPVDAKFVRFTVLATSTTEPCLDELEVFTAGDSPRNVALASEGTKATASSVLAGGGLKIHQIEHVNDGQFGNGHSWISAEPGSGWVQLELAQPATIDRVVWGRDRERAFQDRVATRYRIEVSHTADNWQVVATSDDRVPFETQPKEGQQIQTAGIPAEFAEQIVKLEQSAGRVREELERLTPTTAYVGTFKQPEATHLLYRGEPLQPREQIAPGGLEWVGAKWNMPGDAPEAERRLTLARWIGSPSNPLTARVMVNRIWHYHFGQGLVRTPSDFGFGGGQPTHPELLDYLATEFMANGWQAKAIHRMILLSATYRQSSKFIAEAAAQDATNRWLWRFAPRRLEAEALRDSVLAASGVLDERMGGPGYEIFVPNTNYVKVYAPKQTFGPAEWRRMVYQEKPRARQDGTFGEFDCPDASQTMARRNVSTTALQALNLLNGPFMIQQAELFAQRLQREASGADQQIRLAFWLALGREPDAEELQAARTLVQEQGLLVFCRAIYNANEFLYLN